MKIADDAVRHSGDATGAACCPGRGPQFPGLLPQSLGRPVLGEGAYGQTAAAASVAGSVVDRPQPVGLQFGLAPAGWSLGGYEESRSLDLVSNTDPGQPPLQVSLFGGPGYGTAIDDPFEGRALAAPVEPATIKGLPARVALADGAEGDPDTWVVAGQLPDGPLFLLLAPLVLTREQVLEIAEQVTYTP